MKQIRFALLRHGVTAWNTEKRIQGRTDISITAETATWYRQRRLPAEWRDVPWLTSPLSRTRETAEAVGVVLFGLEPAFIEMDWGAWEGEKLPDLRASLGDSLQDNEDRGWDFRPENGESPRDVLGRVEGFLKESDLPQFGAVTHKGVIRAIYAAARGWDMMGKIPDKLDWHCLQVFNWSDATGLSVEALNVPLVPAQETT